MRHLLIVLSFIALMSCAEKSATAKKIFNNSSIINGSSIKAGDVLGASIVAVYNAKSQYICTGSLITPNIVMTAAHCAPNNAADVKIVFATDVDDVLTAREPDVVTKYVLPAVKFKVGPTWNPSDESREIDTGDILLIKFKGDLPEGYKPATFLTDENLLKIGNLVTVAGYGVDDVDTSKEINPKKYNHLEDAITSGEVYCEDDMNGAHLKCFKIRMSGDGVLRTTKAPISFIHETEINLNETKSGTCSGDSGGPAFIEINGEFFLFGVTSRGSLLCNEVGVYTNALFYKNWIEETIKLFN